MLTERIEVGIFFLLDALSKHSSQFKSKESSRYVMKAAISTTDIVILSFQSVGGVVR
jgi:hypothetical protein